MPSVTPVTTASTSEEATNTTPTKALNNVVADLGAASAPEQAPEKEVEDTIIIFVPFEDFTGRINQTDFNFRKDIPTKVPKAEANVWLEAKKGYIK